MNVAWRMPDLAIKTPAMTLTSEEVERYARQIVLRGVGGPGRTS